MALTLKLKCISSSQEGAQRATQSAIAGQPPRTEEILKRTVKFVPANAKPGEPLDYMVTLDLFAKQDEGPDFKVYQEYNMALEDKTEPTLKSVQ
jgi:hypothetical protein